MQLRPNLHFAGNAGDALAYYQSALGGDLEVTRFKDSPAAASVPPGWEDKILYGRLRSPFGEIDIMDAPPGHESPAGGNIAISLDADSAEHAAEVFTKLAEGGAIQMPFEETFFARKFGMASDKFGVRWMVVFAPVPVGSA